MVSFSGISLESMAALADDSSPGVTRQERGQQSEIGSKVDDILIELLGNKG